MTDGHVPFTLLSDFHDERISEHGKEYVREHLSRCEQCRREYRKLEQMLRMLSLVDRAEIRSVETFTASTMDRIRRNAGNRGRSRFLYRVLPSAAAAMVLFMLGVNYLWKDGSMFEKKTAIMGPSGADYSMVSTGRNTPDSRVIDSRVSIRKNMSILRRNRARILLVTDSYIEAESPAYGFEGIRREILTAGTLLPGRAAGDSRSADLELIGDDHPLISDFISQTAPSRQKTVRFRVNLR